MIITVGSTNQLKINAVKEAVNQLWTNAQVLSINAPSEVNNQPLSDEETITGAINRARNALSNSDYGIGIEGGVHDTKHGMFLQAWTAVINQEGIIGLGCTSRILLPETIANELRQGKELGPVMDDLLKRKNVKHAEGTIGVLTKGLITREESFKQAIINAFTKFRNELYD